MEIEGEAGLKTRLNKGGLRRELGRGLGFDPKDRTVSRRHISFELRRDETQTLPNSKPRVHFEVIGKNPIWVYSSGSDGIRVFRRGEGGEMEDGDMFCVSAEKPIWFSVKRLEFVGGDEGGVEREVGSENELAEGLQSKSSRGLRCAEDFELDLDPVKEFGFLIMGHEFDHYPKHMIRPPKTWNWFLEERKEDSDDDEVSDKKGKKGLRRKRKKDEGNDDDEWTGESEDEKEVITKPRKVQRPNYSTRSKDRDKPLKDTRIGKHPVQKKTIDAGEEDEEDEDDDTLGGFIIKGDDMEEEEAEEVDKDEEEEEEEDYDEDDEEE